MIDPAAHVPLGRTGLSLTRLGLGSAPLAGLFEAVSDDEARSVVDASWERGLRLFDTAPLYGSGLAERRLGDALRTRPRDAYVISTKVGRLLVPGADPDSQFVGADPASPVFDFSADAARRSLESSLERLGLDRVDIALIHDPEDRVDEALEGAYVALEQLRSEGVVGAIGVGMTRTAELTRFARESDIDVVLVAGRYTLLDTSALDDLLPACQSHGVGVIAGGVLNSGILSGAPGSTTFDYAPASAELVRQAARIREVCDRHGVPIAAAALQFPLAHPAVVSVIVGCRTADEVALDAGYLELPIPAALWQELKHAGVIPGAAPV